MSKADPGSTRRNASRRKSLAAQQIERLPAFMRADAGKGLEGTKPEDVAWLGEELLTGDAEHEQEKKFDKIAQEVFNSRHALRLILHEIIRKHPVKDRAQTNKARLDAALTALLGSDPDLGENRTGQLAKRRGGPKELPDDDLLRVMAREYLADAYGFSGKTRSISKLCDLAIEEVVPNWRTMTAGEKESTQRRLTRKFCAGALRDRVMIEYTAVEGQQFFHLVEKALSYLAALGLADQRPRRGHNQGS